MNLEKICSIFPILLFIPVFNSSVHAAQKDYTAPIALTSFAKGCHILNEKEAQKKGLTKVITLKKFHVSCQSERPEKWNGDKDLGGIVLYQYKGKTDWYCNGVHCKSGYLIIREMEKIKNVSSSEGMIHGRVYKSVFKEEFDAKKIQGGGFSYRPHRNPKWKFVSSTLNDPSGQCDKYHDGKREMTKYEEKAVVSTIKNWIETGEQNYEVNYGISFYKNTAYENNDSICNIL